MLPLLDGCISNVNLEWAPQSVMIAISLHFITQSNCSILSEVTRNSSVATDKTSCLHTSALSRLVGWLCFMSHQQGGHLEKAPPFTVPCKGREARFLNHSHWESNPWPSRGSPLHYSCTMLAPLSSRRCHEMYMYILF